MNIKTTLKFKDKNASLTSSSSYDEIDRLIQRNPPGGFPVGFADWRNIQDYFVRKSREYRNDVVNKLIFPAEDFSGRGIVIVGGGPKYFPSVYVNARIIRLLGCDLPIEMFYLGQAEMDVRMRNILESNVPNLKCVDARSLESKYPARILAGWECKVYAIMYSSFREVLMLDADNTPLMEPTFIFDDPIYKKNGSILWPDYAIDKWTHDAEMWRMMGMPPHEEYQVESGQILADKSKCWRALHMAKFYCDYSDYYFKRFYGDKEAFHFGWKFTDTPFQYPQLPGWICNSIIIQHAYNGSHLFSHRAQAKFQLNKGHVICHENPLEEDTLELLDELKYFWDGSIWENKQPSQKERELLKHCEHKKFVYQRVGLDQRDMKFGIDNKIVEGGDRLERRFYIFDDIRNNNIVMSIVGDEGLIALLNLKDYDLNLWEGAWIKHERCPIVLRSYE